MESCAQKKAYKAKDYKSDLKPIWCPGCGDYTVLNSITRALAELALPPEEVAVVSGIGCSSRIPAYTSVYGFHGVHGRALPVATGSSWRVPTSRCWSPAVTATASRSAATTSCMPAGATST
jgi:2-oxoglutarate ferredoxin oxidoreductase subunit beta